MKRRELLQRFSAIAGGTMLGADHLVARSIDWESLDELPDGARIGLFSGRQIRLLNLIADTIIPDTDTPGAKAAKVGQFMAVIVSDCYEPDDQKSFLEGLDALQQACQKKFSRPFQRCTPKQRHDFLVELDLAQKAHHQEQKAGDPPHYFRRLKDLTLWGYFTSEIGATQTLRMVEIPGHFQGCMPYRAGDKAWGGY